MNKSLIFEDGEVVEKEELEGSDNPFALLTLAWLMSVVKEGRRIEEKERLFRELARLWMKRGWGKERLRMLSPLFEEEYERGREEGLKEGIQRGIKLIPLVRKLEDIALIDYLADLAKMTDDYERFKQIFLRH